MTDWSADHGSQNTRGSLPAWEKPVDQGSNPCVPTFFLTRFERLEPARTNESPCARSHIIRFLGPTQLPGLRWPPGNRRRVDLKPALITGRPLWLSPPPFHPSPRRLMPSDGPVRREAISIQKEQRPREIRIEKRRRAHAIGLWRHPRIRHELVDAWRVLEHA